MDPRAVLASFHAHQDLATYFRPPRVTETTQVKHITIQEREISYRFTPHYHPYAGLLAQRLIKGGTPGLQAADTEYQGNDVSLPGSIRLALVANATISVPAGTMVSVAADTQATDSGGGAVALSAGTQVTLGVVAAVSLPGGLSVILDNGMQQTPATGSAFVLAQAEPASLIGEAPAVLSAGTTLVLRDGRTASLAAGVTIGLEARARVTIPIGTSAQMLRSQPLPVLYAELFSSTRYNPSPLVQRPYPVRDLDFTSGGAYAGYNWELFFHTPLTIAMHLSKNQRFVEAQRWLHYLFDPTNDSDRPVPDRFWQVRPFHGANVRRIDEILINLATGEDEALRQDTLRCIEAWKDAPFRPHVIARFRQSAYMYKTVMVYLDNLIAWGDSLFRQDTGEAIDEALMLYVLASNILGPRPLAVPAKGAVRPQNYDNLRGDLRQFGTALRDVEADLPFDLLPMPAEGTPDNTPMTLLRGLGKALYFGVPRNDKLLAYWDTVADRLFKIRNSLNLQGVFRQLALFEPPIDPALLARATAAGLDVGAIVNGLHQPLPLVRFQLLAQKAAEICQEAKALGNALLTAMEKEDGEAMTLLRSRHERVVMEMVEQVKYGQLQETIKSREGLLQSLALAVQRYSYYERQLGRKTDEVLKSIPDIGDLDQGALEKMKLAAKEPTVTPRDIDIDIAQDLGAAGGKIVSSFEAEELEKSGLAQQIQEAIKVLNLTAQGLALIPDFGLDLHFWGLGGNTDIIGGRKLSDFTKFGADIALAAADHLNVQAGRAAKIGSFARREMDWAFQSSLAAGEITQVFKQIRAAQIREAVATFELRNHRQQMKHAEEIEQFLNEEGTQQKGKRTNKALYAWMKREVKGLYAQCFQFAFDMAKRAERALQHELGTTDLTYIDFGYLAGKEGLLAGDRLYFDIKRMEMAYHELNQREFELTKHVSLLQVSPLSLMQLRATGLCSVSLPEAMFDMDCPGHYFRRIKTVSLSVPCVTGPYSGVNCTLTLIKSQIRTTASPGEHTYAREGAEDERFSDYLGSVQSVVTSSGQNDSGMFEASLRDERYLPFEYCGAVSEWRLQLPGNPANGDALQFDYDSIADVILHIRYTAREGGAALRDKAIEGTRATGGIRLMSMRREFATEWAQFTGQQVAAGGRRKLSIMLRDEHYPFWSRGRRNDVSVASCVVQGNKDANVEIFQAATGGQPIGRAVEIPAYGNLRIADFKSGVLGVPSAGPLELFFEDKPCADIWLAIKWAAQ